MNAHANEFGALAFKVDDPKQNILKSSLKMT